jgi:hypothetical protein
MLLLQDMGLQVLPPCCAWWLAGIMPVMTYGGFKRMTGFCKTAVPKVVEERLEAIKDNDEAVKVRCRAAGVWVWGREVCGCQWALVGEGVVHSLGGFQGQA